MSSKAGFKSGHALIVGVRSHKFNPEHNVPITYQDAEAVYKILIDPKKCGYNAEQVQFLHDAAATADGIKDALDGLKNKVKANDTVFIFFAGHGAFDEDDKNYYLATHDVKFVDTGKAELKITAGTGLSQVELLSKLNQIKAERVLMIFNACHSGSLQPSSLAPKKPGEEKKVEGKSLPSATASALLGTGKGRIVISACMPDQLSNFYEDENLTFFVKALTDGLKGKATPSKGFISAFNLYTYVYETVIRVAKRARVKQDPMISVLQGVGPFPVALARKTPRALGLEAPETLPANANVQWISAEESKQWLVTIMGDYIEGDKVNGDKIDTQINSGGGAVVQGSVTVTGGDFVGRDQVNITHHAPTTQGEAELAQQLSDVLSSDRFSLADLKDIGEMFEIDWSAIKGQNRKSKAQALVQICREEGILSDLRDTLVLARKDLKDVLP